LRWAEWKLVWSTAHIFGGSICIGMSTLHAADQ